jgi:cation diffusion facilitator CzcD-associated flavoprotein CzcO
MGAISAAEWEARRRAASGRSCIIVGAGPAGLAAAQVPTLARSCAASRKSGAGRSTYCLPESLGHAAWLFRGRFPIPPSVRAHAVGDSLSGLRR